jgi:hypothetical protein
LGETKPRETRLERKQLPCADETVLENSGLRRKTQLSQLSNLKTEIYDSLESMRTKQGEQWISA